MFATHEGCEAWGPLSRQPGMSGAPVQLRGFQQHATRTETVCPGKVSCRRTAASPNRMSQNPDSTAGIRAYREIAGFPPSQHVHCLSLHILSESVVAWTGRYCRG